jgi:outer membrane PBP1 activator LpoA protein
VGIPKPGPGRTGTAAVQPAGRSGRPPASGGGDGDAAGREREEPQHKAEIERQYQQEQDQQREDRQQELKLDAAQAALQEAVEHQHKGQLTQAQADLRRARDLLREEDPPAP